MTPLRAAMAFLAKREHTRAELARKLARRFDSDSVRAALEDIAARGWLSDLRFARAYIRANGAKFGREKLCENLRIRGVGEDDIGAALTELSADDCARAAAILTAKYRGEIYDEKMLARVKRFLCGRGFAEEDAESAIQTHNRRTEK